MIVKRRILNNNYMEISISEYQLKISGIGQLKEPLTYDKDYHIIVTASLVKDENRTNNDGTFVKRYVVKLTEIEME